ncbi:MAG: cyclase family protein [Chitinophagaceae bacterium]|nr:cyclase family protein [Chitinophagaceae bacterium]
MKLIDLSIAIDDAIKDPLPQTIIYETHEQGADRMAQMTGVDKTAFEGGKSLAGELVSFTTHAGTHVDAPWHYWPTSNGSKSKTIDELPLEWFYSDGVVLNFTDKTDGYAITAQDIKDALQKINYILKPFDIVLLHTGTDKKLYKDDYAQSGPGVSAGATHWLIDQGIKVMGIDTWGWDIPLKYQAAEYKRNPRDGVLFAAHMVGREKEYCQIEKLTNLDKLPSFGFKISVFPVKVKGGSGGWTRAVAFINE